MDNSSRELDVYSGTGAELLKWVLLRQFLCLAGTERVSQPAIQSIKNAVLSLAQVSLFPDYCVGWIPSYPGILSVSGAPLLRAWSLLADIVHGEFILPFLRFSSNAGLDTNI